MRRVTLLFALVVVAVTAFVGSSYAFGSGSTATFRSNLPIRDVAASPLPASQALAINNLIGSEGITRFGITDRSYAEARVIARTTEGPLYAIPGSSGVCLALAEAVTCGDPGGSDDQLTLVYSSGTGLLVGGGITPASVNDVVVDRGANTTALSSTVRHGSFVITPAAGLDPRGHYSFATR